MAGRRGRHVPMDEPMRSPSDDLRLMYLEERLRELRLRRDGLRLRSVNDTTQATLLQQTLSEIVVTEREIRKLNDDAI
jgi:hypothetical protein